MTISTDRIAPTRPDGMIRNTGAVLLTMCFGVFLAQLDSSVVFLGLKHIGSDLDASISEMQWVLDSYNLVYATFLLTGGALGDLYGRRRVFICGVALIAIGSLVCALAQDGPTLIAGRAITGLGAALEVTSSLAIVSITFPDATTRGRALGFWASCNGVAMAIGPTIGGLLVDNVGWRSVFVLSVPIGLLTLLLAYLYVGESRHPHGRQLDPVAQILAVVGLGALAFVTIESQHRGWMSPLIIGVAMAAVGAAMAFVYVERGRAGAMVPLDIFRNAVFNASLAIAGLMTFGMYAMLFLMPLYFQSIAGASAFIAGLELLPISIAFVVVSQKSGALMHRFGARAMLVGGMSLMGAGLLALTQISAIAPMALVQLALIVIGMGLGLNTGPVNAVAVAAVPASRSGTASGLLNTARMTGATMGIALLGAIYAAHAQAGSPSATLSGLRWAFLGGAIAELSGAAIALAFTRADSMVHKPA
jgi:EmrB/QacA subfamily drug resistance transporter